MKNLTLFLVLFILCFTIERTFAAFPIKQEKKPVVVEQNRAEHNKYLPAITNFSSEKGQEEKETGVMSLLALGCGILSVIITFWAGFKAGYVDVGALVAGGVLGLAAIFFGDEGAERKLKVFAYAGAILGSFSVLPILIYALGALVVAFFSGRL
jgi:hypothetical protein